MTHSLVRHRFYELLAGDDCFIPKLFEDHFSASALFVSLARRAGIWACEMMRFSSPNRAEIVPKVVRSTSACVLPLARRRPEARLTASPRRSAAFQLLQSPAEPPDAVPDRSSVTATLFRRLGTWSELTSSEFFFTDRWWELSGGTRLAEEDAEATQWSRPQFYFWGFLSRVAIGWCFSDEMFRCVGTRDIARSSSRASQNKLDLG
jgi:hypothetical protein